MDINLDFSAVWTQASTIINSLWPVLAIPVGLIFGFGILGKIIKEIRSAVGGM